MTDAPRGLGGVLASASFARAYTLAALGAVFGGTLIERLAGRVTYATILAGLCAFAIGMLVARRRGISLIRLVPTTLLAFLGWALVSAFWTTDVTQTLWSWVSAIARSTRPQTQTLKTRRNPKTRTAPRFTTT